MNETLYNKEFLNSVDGSAQGTPISFGQPFAITNLDGTVIFLFYLNKMIVFKIICVIKIKAIFTQRYKII